MDHYSQRIDSNRHYDWYVSTKGEVYKMKHTVHEQERQATKVYLKKHDRDGRYYIRLKCKYTHLARLMAKTFIKEFDPKKHDIAFKDGDFYNCDLYNLKLIGKNTYQAQQAKKKLGKDVYLIKNNKVYKFESINALAKHLGITGRAVRYKLKTDTQGRKVFDTRDTPIKKMPGTASTVYYNEKFYPSFRALGRELGIKHNTVKRRSIELKGVYYYQDDTTRITSQSSDTDSPNL